MAISAEEFHNILGKLSSLLQAARFSEAIDIIRNLPTSVVSNVNIQHLYALALKNTGQVLSALKILSAIVQRYPNQADIHNNLANVYKALNLTSEANAHYQKALSINPKYFDAFKNLIVLLLENNEVDQAKRYLEDYHSAFLNLPNYIKLQADLCAQKKDFSAAAQIYKKLLISNPNYLEATVGLANAYSALDKHQEAIAILKDVLSNKESSSALYRLALSYFEIHEFENAQKCFQRVIDINPYHRNAHRWFNEMLWQLGDGSAFGKSYEALLEKQAENLGLRQDFIDLLIAAEMFESAWKNIELGLSVAPDNVKFWQQKSILLSTKGETSEAENLCQKIWEQEKNLDTGIELVKLSLIQSNYAIAKDVLSQLRTMLPNNQLVLAYEATYLKLTNKAEYEKLTQIPKNIKAFVLPTPEGYSELEDFIADLKALLVSMHTTSSRPLKQTLRLGTQTPGRLLERRHPLLKKLKWAYEQVIQEYIDSMPDDLSHPFYHRKSSRFKITGSWSVKLEDSGFHVNHVHPEGWISSACYISVPVGLSRGEGDIKFGESPLNLGECDSPDLILSPKVGQLVLFPSFMWHGTEPYCSKQMRLTAPFDVIPVTDS